MMTLRCRKAIANAIVEAENKRIRRLRRALRWALDRARWWRGSFLPDDPTIPDFAKGIAYCEKVLKEVKPN